mmetsp:Transcript_18452/g.51276  ORF Transcript_18452/g.51276 Transcript_18452/m.51276 type:complete len:393 (+) Transcript_18452:66-1244(+)
MPIAAKYSMTEYYTTMAEHTDLLLREYATIEVGEDDALKGGTTQINPEDGAWATTGTQQSGVSMLPTCYSNAIAAISCSGNGSSPRLSSTLRCITSLLLHQLILLAEIQLGHFVRVVASKAHVLVVSWMRDADRPGDCGNHHAANHAHASVTGPEAHHEREQHDCHHPHDDGWRALFEVIRSVVDEAAQLHRIALAVHLHVGGSGRDLVKVQRQPVLKHRVIDGMASRAHRQAHVGKQHQLVGNLLNVGQVVAAERVPGIGAVLQVHNPVRRFGTPHDCASLIAARIGTAAVLSHQCGNSAHNAIRHHDAGRNLKGGVGLGFAKGELASLEECSVEAVRFRVVEAIFDHAELELVRYPRREAGRKDRASGEEEGERCCRRFHEEWCHGCVCL